MFFKRKISIENFPKEVIINSKKYFIEFVFSKKRSSSVNIKNNLLIFRMSSDLSQTQLEEYFDCLSKKIFKKIEKSKNLIQEKTIEEVINFGSFEFANERYYIERVNKRGVKLFGNIFHVNLHMDLILVEKYIINLLIKKYYNRLNLYLKQLNEDSYNFEINSFELKNLNSKWGHCTHDNVIMINLKLLNAKREVLDYVIYHELSHIRHKNHSREFWGEVSKHCFNYKNYRKLLKENPPVIFK